MDVGPTHDLGEFRLSAWGLSRAPSKWPHGSRTATDHRSIWSDFSQVGGGFRVR